MTRTERATQAIFKAIDALNQARAPEARIEKSPVTALMGEADGLDSLGLVNLIVAVEEEIEEEFGVTISLADEKARTQADNPLRTVGSLAAYVATLLEGKTDE